MRPGRETADAAALLDGFSACLLGLGLPLARATTHAPTLHPSFRWVMRVWHPGASSLA
ncbi:adenylate/guanylate cyclase domain-containing protein, partial [Methylobacterium sp. WL119]